MRSAPLPQKNRARPPVGDAADDGSAGQASNQGLGILGFDRGQQPAPDAALADDMAGSHGDHVGLRPLEKALERAGLEPFGGDGSWFQELEFRSGVRVVEATNGEEAAGEIERVADRSEGAVVIIEEPLFDDISDEFRRSLARSSTPVVIPVPGPDWTTESKAHEYIVEILRRAIGYRVRLQ